jgi:hypothetical protein
MPDGRCNYQLSTINSDIQHRWPMPMQLSVVNYQQSTATSNIRHPASITQGTGNREQERGGNGGGASARSASAINAATRTESREQRAPAPRWHVARGTTAMRHIACYRPGDTSTTCTTSHAIWDFPWWVVRGPGAERSEKGGRSASTACRMQIAE